MSKLTISIQFLLYFSYLLSTEWLYENRHNADFETMSNEAINELLTIFYTEVKSADGKDLSKSTYVCIRSGIGRHLRNPPYNRNLILHNSETYATSNRMFLSVLKKLKEEGKDCSVHYPAIADSDLAMLKAETAFNTNNPKELQQKVFF